MWSKPWLYHLGPKPIFHQRSLETSESVLLHFSTSDWEFTAKMLPRFKLSSSHFIPSQSSTFNLEFNWSRLKPSSCLFISIKYKVLHPQSINIINGPVLQPSMLSLGLKLHHILSHLQWILNLSLMFLTSLSSTPQLENGFPSVESCSSKRSAASVLCRLLSNTSASSC